jgi:hypothetical protein
VPCTPGRQYTCQNKKVLASTAQSFEEEILSAWKNIDVVLSQPQ